MSTKHTPGPWFVVHELRGTDEIVADLVNETWVIPSGGQQLGDWNADARLISAAPDLLNALSVLVDAADVHGIPCDAARAAIEKATGVRP